MKQLELNQTWEVFYKDFFYTLRLENNFADIFKWIFFYENSGAQHATSHYLK